VGGRYPSLQYNLLWRYTSMNTQYSRALVRKFDARPGTRLIIDDKWKLWMPRVSCVLLFRYSLSPPPQQKPPLSARRLENRLSLQPRRVTPASRARDHQPATETCHQDRAAASVASAASRVTSKHGWATRRPDQDGGRGGAQRRFAPLALHAHVFTHSVPFDSPPFSGFASRRRADAMAGAMSRRASTLQYTAP